MSTQESEKVTVTLTFDRDELEARAQKFAMLRQEPNLPISTADLRVALQVEAQPSPKLDELVEAAKQIEAQLSPVTTARTEQNIDIAHEMAARLKVELRNYMWSEAQPSEGEGGRFVVRPPEARALAAWVQDTEDDRNDELAEEVIDRLRVFAEGSGK